MTKIWLTATAALCTDLQTYLNSPMELPIQLLNRNITIKAGELIYKAYRETAEQTLINTLTIKGQELRWHSFIHDLRTGELTEVDYFSQNCSDLEKSIVTYNLYSGLDKKLNLKTYSSKVVDIKDEALPNMLLSGYYWNMLSRVSKEVTETIELNERKQPEEHKGVIDMLKKTRTY